MSMARDNVVSRLHSAYRALLDGDRALLEVDANERSLTHKLAEHLQAEFLDWNVDCEYNRNGALPKRLRGVEESVSTNDTDGKTVFPDIIVHRRKTASNLMVIEAKKSSTAGSSTDKEKLRAYKAEHGYQFAFAVVFPVGAGAAIASPAIDIVEITL